MVQDAPVIVVPLNVLTLLLSNTWPTTLPVFDESDRLTVSISTKPLCSVPDVVLRVMTVPSDEVHPVPAIDTGPSALKPVNGLHCPFAGTVNPFPTKM